MSFCSPLLSPCVGFEIENILISGITHYSFFYKIFTISYFNKHDKNKRNSTRIEYFYRLCL